MKLKKKKLSKAETMIIALFPFIGIITALILNDLNKYTIAGAVTPSVVLTLVVILVHVSANVFILRTHEQEQVSKLLKSLRKIHSKDYPPWLFSPATMLDLENNYEFTEKIWIVSPDLSNVSDDEMPVRQVVKNNIGRNISYTYFISDSDETFANRKNFESAIKSNKLKFVELPHQYWDEHFKTHMIIFNPDCEKGGAALYFELPLTEVGSCTGHWVLASRKMSNHIIRMLHSKLASQD